MALNDARIISSFTPIEEGAQFDESPHVALINDLNIHLGSEGRFWSSAQDLMYIRDPITLHFKDGIFVHGTGAAAILADRLAEISQRYGTATVVDQRQMMVGNYHSEVDKLELPRLQVIMGATVVKVLCLKGDPVRRLR